MMTSLINVPYEPMCVEISEISVLVTKGAVESDDVYKLCYEKIRSTFRHCSDNIDIIEFPINKVTIGSYDILCNKSMGRYTVIYGNLLIPHEIYEQFTFKFSDTINRGLHSTMVVFTNFPRTNQYYTTKTTVGDIVFDLNNPTVPVLLPYIVSTNLTIDTSASLKLDILDLYSSSAIGRDMNKLRRYIYGMVNRKIQTDGRFGYCRDISHFIRYFHSYTITRSPKIYAHMSMIPVPRVIDFRLVGDMLNNEDPQHTCTYGLHSIMYPNHVTMKYLGDVDKLIFDSLTLLEYLQSIQK